jgi:cytochrome c-type biogenesis protein CcmH
VALSTLSLLVLAIAAVTAGLAFALPRLFARRDDAVPIPGRTSAAGARLAVVAAGVGIAAMTIGLIAYFDRDDAADGEASVPDLASLAPAAASGRPELVRHLARNPRDGRSWVLLARLDFEADRFADAAVAYERAIAASPKVASDPAIWCEYADAVGMAHGGSLAGKPRELIMRALAQEPAFPRALEMAGSAAFEAGDYAATLRYWRQLLPKLAADSPERRELATAIARVEQRAPAAEPEPGVGADAK